MSRTFTVLLAALSLLVVGGGIGVHLRAARPQVSVNSTEGVALSPTAAISPRAPAQLHGGNLVVRHQGRKQLEVRAARISVTPDLRYVTFAGITRVALYQEGAEALHLRAREATLDRQTNDLRVRGPLEITSAAGYQLRAPEAAWDAARRQLLFPGGVEMVVEGTIISASRLTVDLSGQILLFEGSVDIAFTVPGGGP